MEVTTEMWNQWCIVHPRGELVLSTMSRVREAFSALVQRRQFRVALDLAELEILDSSALGLITRFAEELAGQNGELAMFNARRGIAEILGMVQFGPNVRIYSGCQQFEAHAKNEKGSAK